MDPHIIILAIAVLGASALQSATGIGFGVIAGPVLLVVLNSGTAIQISVVLNLLIALVLAPSRRRKVDRALLLRFLLGSLAGLPLGLWVFLSIGIDQLKFLAGLAVLFTLVFVSRANRKNRTGNPGSEGGGSKVGDVEQISLGAVSGALSGSLAMPGPVPAAWMSARAYGKDTVRATILALFVFSYSAALVLQAFLVGVSQETLWQSLLLTPPTLAGIYLGHLLANRLTERIFRRVLFSVLAATMAGLFLSSIPNLFLR